MEQKDLLDLYKLVVDKNKRAEDKCLSNLGILAHRENELKSQLQQLPATSPLRARIEAELTDVKDEQDALLATLHFPIYNTDKFLAQCSMDKEIIDRLPNDIKRSLLYEHHLAEKIN